MPMKPRPGQVLASTVDSTTVIVVRAPDREISLTCAGVEMWDPRGGGACPAGEADPAQLAGAQVGKRYADEGIGLELLCTKPGKGTIAVNGVPLPQCGAKLLPASDLAGGCYGWPGRRATNRPSASAQIVSPSRMVPLRTNPPYTERVWRLQASRPSCLLAAMCSHASHEQAHA